MVFCWRLWEVLVVAALLLAERGGGGIQGAEMGWVGPGEEMWSG